MRLWNPFIFGKRLAKIERGWLAFAERAHSHPVPLIASADLNRWNFENRVRERFLPDNLELPAKWCQLNQSMLLAQPVDATLSLIS